MKKKYIVKQWDRTSDGFHPYKDYTRQVGVFASRKAAEKAAKKDAKGFHTYWHDGKYGWMLCSVGTTCWTIEEIEV